MKISTDPNEAFGRGFADAGQDAAENAPFASVGGLGARTNMKAPAYVDAAVAANYLDGYAAFARLTYGDEWRTCEFGWRPAMTVPTDPAPTEGT